MIQQANIWNFCSYWWLSVCVKSTTQRYCIVSIYLCFCVILSRRSTLTHIHAHSFSIDIRFQCSMYSCKYNQIVTFFSYWHREWEGECDEREKDVVIFVKQQHEHRQKSHSVDTEHKCVAYLVRPQTVYTNCVAVVVAAVVVVVAVMLVNFSRHLTVFYRSFSVVFHSTLSSSP